MSIMLLVERGRLSLDDAVRKYLPEMPDYGRPLTIRHLLNHTSGLRDAFLILELSAPEDGYGDRNDVILKQLARQRSLNYKPGTEFLYNNGGYVLAAIIVKRVSGQPLAAFADANIFTPLGMTSTRFQDDPSVVMPNRASNYHRDAGNWRFVPFGTQPGAVGNSGLWTTPRDLLRWASNLVDPKVGPAPPPAEMQKPAVTSAEVRPGGWDSRSANIAGRRSSATAEAITASTPTLSGTRSSSLRSPCCNTDDIGARQLTQRIADVYAPAPPTEDRREGDAEQQDAGEAVHELCPGLRSEVISHSPDTWFDYEAGIHKDACVPLDREQEVLNRDATRVPRLSGSGSADDRRRRDRERRQADHDGPGLRFIPVDPIQLPPPHPRGGSAHGAGGEARGSRRAGRHDQH